MKAAARKPWLDAIAEINAEYAGVTIDDEPTIAVLCSFCKHIGIDGDGIHVDGCGHPLTAVSDRAESVFCGERLDCWGFVPTYPLGTARMIWASRVDDWRQLAEERRARREFWGMVDPVARRIAGGKGEADGDRDG